MTISDLPAINASLNFISTIFISAGWYLIRRGHWRHILCIDHYRSVRKERETIDREVDANELTPASSDPSPIAALEQRDRVTLLRHALSELPDTLRTAFQTGQTRVASLRMIKEASMRTFPPVNVDEAFHPLSHHGEDPDKQEKLARVQTYQIERLQGRELIRSGGDNLLPVRSAERALSDGEPVELEPMTAVERKVVHVRLKEFDGVETTSEGTEPNRHVVVHPV